MSGMKKTKLFLDMDGVLVDLEKAVHDSTGSKFGSRPAKHMWKLIYDSSPNIFRDAEPMPDALELVEGALDFADRYDMTVEILTAVPVMKSFPNAKKQKKEWLEINIPHLDVPFNIGPFAKDKHKHASLGDILIDDSWRNMHDWARAGGIAIHHVNSSESLVRLETSHFRRMKIFF